MTKFIDTKFRLSTDKKERQAQVDRLNDLFTPLTFKERIKRLYDIIDEQHVMITSSFGTKSVFLLHLLHQIRPTQQVHFIDTTYHFPETIAYKNELIAQFGIKVLDVLPHRGQNQLTTDEQWWNEHPRMCCTINKIAPIEPIVAKHQVWISGLMAYQTPFRARLRVFELQGDIVKFHPLVDIDEGEFLFHMDKYQLPRHPLESKGYGSIGCIHCTQKGQGRSGRWAAKEKTECGLHPNFYNKKK